MKALSIAYAIHFAFASGSLLIGILTNDTAMYVLSVFWLALMVNWKVDQLLQNSGRTHLIHHVPAHPGAPNRSGATTGLFVAGSLMDDLEKVLGQLSAELDVSGTSGESTDSSALASRLTRATIQLCQLRNKLQA
jgi:hypothetical protein